MAESIPGSLNVYKFGLWTTKSFCHIMSENPVNRFFLKKHLLICIVNQMTPFFRQMCSLTVGMSVIYVNRHAVSELN